MGKASRRKLHARMQASAKMTVAQLKAWGVDIPVHTHTNLPQEQKISNAIGKILDTEIDQNSSLETYRACVNSIVMAWNMTLMPPDVQEERLKMLEAFIHSHSQGDVENDIRESLLLVKRLMQKKKSLFPDDKRYIVFHDCQFIGGKVHITAAGLSEPNQTPPVS